MVHLDRDEYERWSAQAHTALEGADVLGDRSRPEWACFLYEQAAQMALKALLHGIGGDAWGHDLTTLTRRVADEHPEFAAAPVAAAAARLSRLYIAARYPDAHATGAPGAHFAPDDVHQAKRDALLVIDTVGRAWQSMEATGQ